MVSAYSNALVHTVMSQYTRLLSLQTSCMLKQFLERTARIFMCHSASLVDACDIILPSPRSQLCLIEVAAAGRELLDYFEPASTGD